MRIGATDISSKEGFYIRVSKIIVHEGWNRDTNLNDIALYKTDRPIKFEIDEKTGQYVINSICLPRDSYSEPNFGIVAGWGQFGEKTKQMMALQKLIVPRFDWQTCKNNYQELGIVDYNMFCYGGEGGRDSCLVSHRWTSFVGNIDVGLD